MALLHLDGISFAYGGRRALEAVTLSVEAGEVVALVGPNGAGKSTLLRVAAGLLPASTGAVLVDGRDVRDLARHRLARIVGGVAAREEGEFPFTVRETVALGRHPWRGRFAPLTAEDEGRIDGALGAVDLAHLASRTLPSLSTGERQRVALARALAQDPRVLLLDEPTAHLDLGQRLRVLDALRAVARSGTKAVLAALHDLSSASLVADRIALLVGGRLLAAGPPGEVLTASRVREAFGAEVDVFPHPRTGAPVVVPLAAVPERP